MISFLLVLKLPGYGLHNSARHQHLCPSHATGTSTARIYIAMEVEKSVTLRGIKLADTNRPPVYRVLSKAADLATKRVSDWRDTAPSIKTVPSFYDQFTCINVSVLTDEHQ